MQDPTDGLSLAAFSSLIGLTEDVVKSGELAGKFFSLRRPCRGGAREYPAFQLRPGIVGQPLELVLEALGDASGAEAYAFFTSPQDTLCGLAPAEILQGEATRRIACAGFQDCLARMPSERLEIVLSAARTYAQTLRA